MSTLNHIDWRYMLAFAFLAWTALSSTAAVFISRRFWPREPESMPLEPGHQVHPDTLPEARFEPRERSEA